MAVNELEQWLRTGYIVVNTFNNERRIEGKLLVSKLKGGPLTLEGPRSEST